MSEQFHHAMHLSKVIDGLWKELRQELQKGLDAKDDMEFTRLEGELSHELALTKGKLSKAQDEIQRLKNDFHRERMACYTMETELRTLRDAVSEERAAKNTELERVQLELADMKKGKEFFMREAEREASTVKKLNSDLTAVKSELELSLNFRQAVLDWVKSK